MTRPFLSFRAKRGISLAVEYVVASFERCTSSRLLLATVFLLGLCCSVLLAAPSPGEFDLGFFGCRDIDPEGNARLRILGPLYESRRRADGTEFKAFRPFYSRTYDPSRDRVVRHFLWPVSSVKDLRSERFWHFLPAYGNVFDTSDPGSRWRFVVPPVLFTGRSANGEGYFGLFPLGGKIHEIVGMDTLTFVLFPLYACDVTKDLTTHSIFWPLISWTKGDDVSRFRVAPFYGRSVKEGRWEKEFIMWPLWSSARYHLPRSTGGGFLVFPLFGVFRTTDRHGWTILPPLFRYSKSKTLTTVHCPWPFIQYASGDDVRKLFVWPLWGTRTQSGHTVTFYLWPLVRAQETRRKEYVLKRFSVIPVYHHEKRTAAQPGTEDVLSRYVRIWPLVSYRREGSDRRIRTLELWPMKDMPGVEKNLAPFWTLYEQTRVGDVEEYEFLWGLFRRRRDGRQSSRVSVFPLFRTSRDNDGDGSRNWDVLHGLAGYSREGLRRNYRLLYFARFGAGPIQREEDRK